MAEWIRLSLALISLTAGAVFSITGVFGTFRMNYVLNRMHSAAVIDTCALLFASIGLIILNGFNFVSLKLVLVVIFLWMSSPVSSHLISSLNYMTHKEDVMKICEYVNLVEDKKEEREDLKDVKENN